MPITIRISHLLRSTPRPGVGSNRSLLWHRSASERRQVVKLPGVSRSNKELDNVTIITHIDHLLGTSIYPIVTNEPWTPLRRSAGQCSQVSTLPFVARSNKQFDNVTVISHIGHLLGTTC